MSSTYVGWEFGTVWGMACEGFTYPYLLSLPPDPLIAPVNVTINRNTNQDDPTDIPVITFDVTFDSVVTGFDNGDLDFTGSTALIADAIVTDTGDSMHYTVQVFPSTEGTITAAIPADIANAACSVGNAPSTSADNTVLYMTVLPEIPVTAWPIALTLLLVGIGVIRIQSKYWIDVNR